MSLLDSADEKTRKALRQHFRERLARAAMEESRSKAISDALANEDKALDAATEAHRKATDPIQAELTEVEGAIMQRLIARQPVDAALEAKRSKLLARLDEANAALQLAAERHRSRQGPLSDELYALATRRDHVRERELAGEQLGNPALLDKQWSAARAVDYASSRAKAAAVGLAEIKSSLSYAERRAQPARGWARQDQPATADNSDLERQRRRWAIEIDAANTALAAAQAELATITAQLIAE
jgi:hypothetical protein